MKLTSQQIRGLAEEIISELMKSPAVKFKAAPGAAASAVEQAIIDDLMVEEKLNDEVRGLLKAYEREIEQGKADYKTMFELVKKKLVRERGLVL